MQRKLNIFIGGGSVCSENYYNAAVDLGNIINITNYNIVYDGCKGLPGVVFEQINDKTRSVIYYSTKYPMPPIDKGIICGLKNQSQVTISFIENSDAMIFFKGGPGTWAEIMYAIDSKKNNEHNKPIVILNINGEWNIIINVLKELKLNDLLFVTENVESAVDYIQENIIKYKDSDYIVKCNVKSN